MRLRILKHHLDTNAKELKERSHNAGHFAAHYKEMLQRQLPKDRLQYSVGINPETGGPDWQDVPVEYVGVPLSELEGNL